MYSSDILRWDPCVQFKQVMLFELKRFTILIEEVTSSYIGTLNILLITLNIHKEDLVYVCWVRFFGSCAGFCQEFDKF